MTLRVVHVAAAPEWRGGQRQVWLLARALALRSDLTQAVLTSAGSELARRLESAHIATRQIRWRSGPSFRAVASLLRARPRPHLLHAHDAHAVIVAGIFSALTAVPFVVTRRNAMPLRRRGFWIRARRVIAISEAVHTSLVRSGIPGEIVSLIPSGVDLEALRRVVPHDLRRELSLDSDHRLAIAVGALTAEKDHATALQALALTTAGVHLALVGDGPLRGALEGLARRAGVAQRVHFLGWRADPEPLVAAADLLLHTSTSEGLGTTILDAMALGVPVVATAAGAVPELEREGSLLLAPVGDAEGVARQMTRVLGDTELRARLVSRGHQRVREFEIGGLADRVWGVYRSAVSHD